VPTAPCRYTQEMALRYNTTVIWKTTTTKEWDKQREPGPDSPDTSSWNAQAVQLALQHGFKVGGCGANLLRWPSSGGLLCCLPAHKGRADLLLRGLLPSSLSNCSQRRLFTFMTETPVSLASTPYAGA
jgi:hypothetical protein